MESATSVRMVSKYDSAMVELSWAWTRVTAAVVSMEAIRLWAWLCTRVMVPFSGLSSSAVATFSERSAGMMSSM